MADSGIPLWKQELLKRKQGKLTHEKLASVQHDSKQRSSFANSTNSTVLNHSSTRMEKKPEFQQNVHVKNYSDSAKKGSLYNRNLVLDKFVDRSDTRQTSGNLKSKIRSAGSEPNRLDSFDDRLVSAKYRDTAKYNKNFDSTRGGSNVLHGTSQNSRGIYKKEEKAEVIILNENDTLKDCAVDCEHIRPQDVKKMWQRQATKEETSPKSHPVGCHKNQSVVTHSTKEISPNQPPSNDNLSHPKDTQVNSKPTSVPKAYKSPYAKRQWNRQASTSDKKPVKNIAKPHLEENEVKLHTVKPPLSNGNQVNESAHENVEDEHIQSVKSLLGLFGGKAKPTMGRKVSDNVLLSNKSAKQPHGKSYPSESKILASKKPGLFKHHSEPNLYFPAENNVITDISPRAKKSPTSEEAVEEIVPSHHVSQGIQDRLTRLRRASHSNMEEMDGFMEYQNGIKTEPDAEHVKKSHQSEKVHQKHSNIVIEKTSPNKLDSSKLATVQYSIANHSQEFVKNTVTQNDNEKPGLSGNVNNKPTSPVSDASKKIENHQNVVNSMQNENKEISRNEAENEQSFSTQSFDKIVPEFEPEVINKSTISADMTDTKGHVSENKYQDKQSKCPVENNQSDGSLYNQAVSTKYSTGINQSQHEAKPVIKNEENIKNNDEKPVKKPRRKGLNVVDPLAVLQLTKDPILLKEKPSAAELGLKESGSKPKDIIIKHEPDKKAKIAQINRAWDLDNVQPVSKQNNVGPKTMPANSIQSSPESTCNIPESSVDEIPVSVIDDVIANKSSPNEQPKPGLNSSGLKIGNATFYDSLLSAGLKAETGLADGDEEFIPVSSIDDEVDLGPPPKVVFDKMPEKLKSCFARNGQV